MSDPEKITIPPVPVRTETSPKRGTFPRRALRECLLSESAGVGPTNVLIVGAGLNTVYGKSRCPHEPYQLAAMLEAATQEYQMTIVDSNPEVIADIQQREIIFYPVEDRDWDYDEEDEAAWNNYLQDLGLIDRIIHKIPDELQSAISFIRLASSDQGANRIDELVYQGALRRGVHIAKIPDTFLRKLANGEVELIQGDIAMTHLPDDHFGFCSMMNLLCYLDVETQKSAVYTVACSLKGGGVLVLNEHRAPGGKTPLFAEAGGWLGEPELQSLGLEVVDVTDNNDKSPDFRVIDKIMRKKSIPSVVDRQGIEP
ncbi:hypothetical protein HY468_02175 [Candidatus Roizmanbacteria bacterium]|nr:hypothetical protein [Candidatus Roizmanbacteria bacterium]